jgi:hypothetical protein
MFIFLNDFIVVIDFKVFKINCQVTRLFFSMVKRETKFPRRWWPLNRADLNPSFQIAMARLMISSRFPGSSLRKLKRKCISLSRGDAKRFWKQSNMFPKSRSQGEVEGPTNFTKTGLDSAACLPSRAWIQALRSARGSLSEIRSPEALNDKKEIEQDN